MGRRSRGEMSAWTVLLGALVLCGTGFGCRGKDDIVMARVGDTRITLRMFKEEIAKLPESDRAYRGSVRRTRANLRVIIDKELMLSEAQARGLDTSKVVMDKVERTKRTRVLKELYQKKVAREPEVSEADMRAYFTMHGLDEEAHLSRIVVRTLEEGREMVKAIRSGVSFEELARKRSLDRGSAGKGGDIGWQSKDVVPKVVLERVFPLAVGEVSEPFMFGRRCYVAKVLEKRTVSFDDRKQHLEKTLKRQAVEKVWQSYIEDLKTRYGMVVVDSTVALLAETGGGAELAPELAQRTLVRFREGHLSVRDYLRMLETSAFLRKSPAWSDRARVRDYVEQVVVRNELMWWEAQRAGMDRDPSLLADMKRLKQKVMAEGLRRMEVVDKVEVSEEEARTYYTDHREQYRRPVRVTGVEVLVETEEEAFRIRRLAEQGADLRDLAARYSIRPRGRERRGIFRLPGQQDLYGEAFVDHVLKAKVGTLNGPVKVQAGYTLFEVLDRDEGGYEPFERMQRVIMKTLRVQKEGKRFADFLEELRTKYDDRIHVDEGNLRIAAQELDPRAPKGEKLSAKERRSFL